jgi:hypothetical protein
MRIGTSAFVSMAMAMGMAVTGCGDGPPEGSASGTFGGQAIDVKIDAGSQFYLQRKISCTSLDQSIFHLSYGGGALKLDFQLDGGPSIFGDLSYAVPTTGAPLVSFTVTPSTPALVSGSLKVGITGLWGRRNGSFDLVFADGSTVTGTFDLEFETRGDRLDCGGSSGSDDWD